MTLDPQVVAWRAARAAAGTAPLYTQTLAQARAADLAAIRAGSGAVEPVHEVRDTQLPGPGGPLPVRIHRPAGDGPLPTLVYFFGGGWTLGSVDTADGICRRLVNLAGCQTITVGYRLAPEHRFPAAVDDCSAAVRRLAGHAEEFRVDPDRLAVGGDSAGGNLTAAVTLLARADGGPRLAAQVLVYPNTDQRPRRAPSGDEDPLLFNRHSVEWYRRHYLADPGDAAHPLASPLLAEDLAGLPPALVITAEHDPLRDEGERYAERLAEAGVATEATRYEGMVHGFFAMPGVFDAGKRAQEQVAAFLRARFGLTPAGATTGAAAGGPDHG
ncbi:alpha/beta hydrolase fold domain-containing protein [Micromonospora terminaliae]|uniref:Alpha/beta hydrolase n=1 Tax=Micromonospora terminaliae TaxID=1914461 RepID=A0AAJ3DKQ2_9ACTN|nr:alpha/beta hydrolase [Micromonospora terminaliae]NES27335.1 alpha/beta hydrolase [Micromonospora terminaliae]QGL47917.1 alpha/beta hydrolase fold domain-containing protein [Micromonospora terminaliae]